MRTECTWSRAGVEVCDRIFGGERVGGVEGGEGVAEGQVHQVEGRTVLSQVLVLVPGPALELSGLVYLSAFSPGSLEWGPCQS